MKLLLIGYMHFDFLNIFSLLQNYRKLTIMELLYICTLGGGGDKA